VFGCKITSLALRQRLFPSQAREFIRTIRACYSFEPEIPIFIGAGLKSGRPEIQSEVALTMTEICYVTIALSLAISELTQFTNYSGNKERIFISPSTPSYSQEHLRRWYSKNYYSRTKELAIHTIALFVHKLTI